MSVLAEVTARPVNDAWRVQVTPGKPLEGATLRRMCRLALMNVPTRGESGRLRGEQALPDLGGDDVGHGLVAAAQEPLDGLRPPAPPAPPPRPGQRRPRLAAD